MGRVLARRRMLFVHAHPDDETIETGATMAAYAAGGAHVTLVTCTLGEEGEILVPELAHLASDRDDALGAHRVGELSAACAVLGVTDHRFLGGPGRWRDSGMMGAATNDVPECFWRADVDEAAGELVAVMREVRPQVVVTYDERGYYGHPDHIQAHRVTRRAFELAGDAGFGPPEPPPWCPAKLYATAMPRSALVGGIAELRAANTGFAVPESVDALPFGVPDEQVTSRVDASDWLDAKLAAMRAHATQIRVDPPFFSLSDGVGQRALGCEYYTLVSGRLAAGDEGPETDLFAGLGSGAG